MTLRIDDIPGNKRYNIVCEVAETARISWGGPVLLVIFSRNGALTRVYQPRRGELVTIVP